MSPLELTVTDVRQHTYCPRIPYYRYTMPLERPTTAKMDLGKEEHGISRIRLHVFTGREYGCRTFFRVYFFIRDCTSLSSRNRRDHFCQCVSLFHILY